MLSTCYLLVLFVFLFLLLLLARVARVIRASSPRGSDMATATSTSEPEGEKDANRNGEEEQPTTTGDTGSEGWKTVSKFSHSIYRKLSCLNGELNALSLSELKEKLTTLNLSSVGGEPVLRKRIKQHMRKQLIQRDPSPPWDLVNQVEGNPYGLDYLCILDFEATCEEVNPPDFIHEIIEFPVLLLNLKTLEIDAEFHQYCRPFLSPHLSDFCKKLTGINQAQVNKAKYFPEVFKSFTEWMESNELSSKYKFSLATDCPWDIKECLFPQCVLSRVSFPTYAVKWIDIRKLFSSFYQIRSGNISSMLTTLGLSFEGRQHCGLDDTRNIVRVAVQMIKDGCVLKYNRFMPNDVLVDYGLGGHKRKR